MLINICEALNGSFELTMKMKQGDVKIIRPINNIDNIQVINHRKTTLESAYKYGNSTTL
jgi:flavoprotein